MTTMRDGPTCSLPTFTVPDPLLRATVLFDQVDVVHGGVRMTFTVQPLLEMREGSRMRAARCAEYSSIRIVLPKAQALSLQAALHEALG